MSELERWLEGLGLAGYADSFKRNDIDLDVLPHLREDDLKALGLSLGHRLKLLAAISERTRAASSPATSSGDSAPSTYDVPLDAERRQLTVMFCDLVGSTALLHQMESEEFRDMILAYQDACRKAIRRFDGYVARYLGDGILMYFGYPKAHEDDAERAVRAGLEIIRSIEKLGTELRMPPDLVFAVRIGIATGPVIVDLVGEGGSRESSALGETPHLAARLQALAAPNGILIAATTRRLLGELFAYEDLGTHDLKGFSTAMRAWKVVQDVAVENRFDALHQQLTPLIGRDDDVDTLMQRWESARDGNGQVMLISGEAGIGKSRLIQSLYETLPTDSTTMLRYQCSAHYTNSALHPVVEQLQRAAGINHLDTREVQRGKLAELLSRSTDRAEETLPLFASLLSIASEEDKTALKLTPQQQKQQTLAALYEQLCTLAAQRTVVVIVEDVHWIDPTTRELLDLILPKIKDRCVLALLTFRPEFQPSWKGGAHVTTLVLNKLSPEHVEMMLHNVTGGRALPAAVRDRIVDKTDGIPLFVEELTRTVLESGMLRQESDRYVLEAPLGGMSIPATLQDSLMARLDRLASVKDVAQIGSVIGREFGYELLRAVAGLADDRLAEALQRLIGAGLILQRNTSGDPAYVFKHALIQDTAYESLLKSRRKQLHAKIARALKEQFAQLAETQPEIAAYHFSQAGLTGEAVECWHEAGRKASQRSANTEAAHHLSAAVAALETLAASEENRQRKLNVLVESIAPVSAIKGYSAPEIEHLYQQALEISRTLDNTPQIYPVMYGRWLVAYVRGHLPQALDSAEQLLSLAQSQKAALPTLVARRCVGTVLAMGGKPAGACSQFQEVVAGLDEAGSDTIGYVYGQDTLVAVRVNYAIALGTSGYLDQARSCLDLGLSRGERLKHTQTSVFGHTVAGYFHAMLREPEPLARHADAVGAIVHKHPMALWAQAPTVLRGFGALLGRQYEASRAMLVESIAAGETLQYYLWRPATFRHLAEAFLGIGDCEHALESVEKGLREIELGRDSWYEADLHRIRGRTLQARGDPSEAVVDSFQKGIEIARAQSAKLFELRSAVDLARYWSSRNKTSEARALLAPVYDWFTEGFDTTDVRDARDLLATLAAG